MKSKPGTYLVLIYLLTSISLTSCGSGGGGGGDINVNIDGGNFKFPLHQNTDFKAEEPFSEEVLVGNHSQMRLKGINDKITITGISGATSVMITGMKRVKSDSAQDASEHLSDLEVNVQSLANEIFIETILPGVTEGRRYEVDYSITLPNDLEIQITNMNRNVTINTIDNNITVYNVNGDVTLTEIFGSAVVNVTNGIIESEVTLPLNGTIELNTMNGNINLDIPANTSAGFSATVNVGSISDSRLLFQNEVRTSDSLIGTLGNGQGTISLESSGTGNISVTGF